MDLHEPLNLNRIYEDSKEAQEESRQSKCATFLHAKGPRTAFLLH